MKKGFLLLMACLWAGLTASAKYVGTAPVAGQSYYLLNVYQSKFMTHDNYWGTQVSVSNAQPVLCTVETSGTGYKINTHFSLTTGAWNASANNWLYVNTEPQDDGTTLYRPYVNSTWGDSDANPAERRTPQTWDIEQSDYGYTLSYQQGGVKMALMFDKGTACMVKDIAQGYNLDCAQWLFITPEEYAEMQAKPRFTMACLNVDGMPKSIKVAGVYTVDLNPDAKEGPGATAIGQKLKTSGWDVVGVSEDFNYHSELWNAAWNGGVDNTAGYCYNATKHRGSLKGDLAAVGDYLGKKPISDTDGLCLFYRRSRLSTIDDALTAQERYVAWTAHNGYTDSGADGMINKGFRYIPVSLNNGTSDPSDDITVDVYILHMDAETNPGDNAARESQMKQLADYILATHNGRPIIVMGDTNCRYTRDPLKQKFVDYITADERFTCKDAWIELARNGFYPDSNGGSIMVGDYGYRRGEVVDKVFYINNTESNYRIVPEQFRQDISFINEAGEPLADHWPMVVEFSYHTYDPLVDDIIEETPEAITMEGVYLRNRETGYFLKAGGWWNTHAVQGTYGAPMSITQVSGNKYTLNSVNIPGGLSEDSYMDQTSPEYTLLQRNGYYVFTANGKALTANDGLYFPGEYGPNKRYVNFADLNVADPYQQWEILTKEDLLAEAAEANPTKPYNLTFMLPGANFDRLDKNNSEWNSNTGSATRMRTTLETYVEYQDNTNGEVYVDKCPKTHTWPNDNCSHGTTWNVWHNTLTNMPNGLYIVRCQAFQENSTNKAEDIYLYANSVQAPIALRNSVNATVNGKTTPGNVDDAAHFFDEGYYVNETPMFTVTDGTINLGVRRTGGQLGKKTTSWTCFDNFQIIYLGRDLAEPGNVNRDGRVSISDVPALVDWSLHGNPDNKYSKTNIDSLQGDTYKAKIETLVNKIAGK